MSELYSLTTQQKNNHVYCEAKKNTSHIPVNEKDIAKKTDPLKKALRDNLLKRKKIVLNGSDLDKKAYI